MMKKYFASFIMSVCFAAVQGQTLFTEDFNSYPVGNFGTDFTGTVPNQGGWYTLDKYPPPPLFLGFKIPITKFLPNPGEAISSLWGTTTKPFQKTIFFFKRK